ncbi:tubulin-specific chaperone C-like [Tropilaelaps mercedesae]|uniref:Tubulin-specific chaperone C-like n=1 Tax=Tropilaelaps mercedesae TaxID=418985 RepID=A0A1V9XPR3_9ACAR|nr:tubulin-specific chaperone C-like [Tropilaelaps mercedesae]
MASVSESQRLFALFAEQASKIDASLEETNVEKTRALLQELQRLVNLHAASLPARDQRTYRERIEGYKKRLDGIKGPKKRFAFSKATKGSPAEKVQAFEQKTDVALQHNDVSSDAGVTKVANATFTIEGRCGVELELNDVHGEVELRNLDKCRVVIRGCPSTLYINDVDECEIISDPVASSVLIVGFRGSSLQVACQQLRVHKSVSSMFRLHITSRSIIEECRDIVFGRLPPEYSASDESWRKSGLDRSHNNFADVDDFDWLNANQPSPNWALLN